MAQGFYSLAEAANVLGISAEELGQKAQNQEVRAFADKGTWRFRAEDIEALAKGSSGEFDVGAAPGSSEFEVGMGPPDSNFDVGVPPASGGSDLSIPAAGSGNALDGGSSEFELSVEQPPQPMGGGSDFELTMEADAPGFAAPPAGDKPPSVLKLAEDVPPLTPTGDLNLGNVMDAPAPVPKGGSHIEVGAAPTAPAAAGGSDVRLSLESGSFEFDLKVDSSGRLGSAEPAPGRKTTGGPGKPSTGGEPAGGDDEVQLDFDASTIDDSMLLVGEQRPDSDVRIEPVSMVRPAPSGALPAGEDMMRTEEIDLDAELRKAEEASRLAKRKSTGQKTKPAPDAAPGKTQLPGPSQPTMLPDLPAGSPFELSEEDLQLPQGSKRGGAGSASGSEFELSLAPEDQDLLSPLNLGDDEDVDLGAAPAKSDLGSGRAELSGINLGRPADSGISLEKGASSDRVDFELTLDDESMTGPKTVRGKVVDSDSEFELTIDDSGVMKDSSSSEQKDIFEETDFDISAPPSSSEESGSQAVALDDTDLESSDFDLAIDESGSSDLSVEESGSQVLALEEGGERKTKVVTKPHLSPSDSEIGEIDSLFDEDLVAPEPEPEPEPAAEDEELAPATVPAAQAEWGVVPVMLLAPCVAMMMLAGLMSYELLHGMWGYHQGTKPGGILVSNLSSLFTGQETKE